MSDSSPLLPGPNGAEDFTDSPDGANLEANHGADIPHKHTLEPLSGMQSHTREISNLLPEIAKGHVTVDPPIQEERRESNHSKSRDASSVADINHEYLHTEPMIGLTDQQIDDRLAIFGSNGN